MPGPIAFTSPKAGSFSTKRYVKSISVDPEEELPMKLLAFGLRSGKQLGPNTDDGSFEGEDSETQRAKPGTSQSQDTTSREEDRETQEPMEATRAILRGESVAQSNPNFEPFGSIDTTPAVVHYGLPQHPPWASLNVCAITMVWKVRQTQVSILGKGHSLGILQRKHIKLPPSHKTHRNASRLALH